jgi:uncharacterized membrane protein YGL010W
MFIPSSTSSQVSFSLKHVHEYHRHTILLINIIIPIIIISIAIITLASRLGLSPSQVLSTSSL